MDEPTLLEILEIGTHAISAYNRQPWRFAWKDNRLEIFMLRTKNFFLKLEGVTYMELGALLENLMEAAAYKNLRAEFSILSPFLGLDTPCAAIRFSPGSPQTHDIHPVLLRCTNRKLYLETPLKESAKQKLLLLNHDPNIQMVLSEGPEKVRLAGTLAYLEGVRYSNRRLRSEGLHYVRLKKEETEKYRDLLDVRVLEWDPRFISILLRLGPSWSFHRLFLLLGWANRLRVHHHRLLVQSGALISFVIQKRDYQSFIHLGQLIQKVLNVLSAEGVESMSVLSGLYLVDVLQENPEIFSPEELETVVECQGALESFFRSRERKVAFIVRAGYADRPRVRSLRKDPRELLLKTC